ncbi:MAG: NAD-dependent epimerase/dehydratase family protein [Bacteroidota bacterium]
MDKVSPQIIKEIKRLKGPICIFGAGGFIGINLLNTLLLYRKDVYGISKDINNNWRFMASQTPLSKLITCDINDTNQVKELIEKLKPKTIFNLAAFGAYSKQKEYKLIYDTNFNATIGIIEILKQYNFSAYIHAGSSSEYGLNSSAPDEQDNLIPNSHYAVSKTAAYYAIKYYGEIEKLPVVHLRLYSAYGPWEEPDRLIPVLIAHARKNKFPPLVQPLISRDFIYISDVISAFICSASQLKKKQYGKVYNVGTGKKTTIKQLAGTVKKLCKVSTSAHFGKMKNRLWDVQDWYANVKTIKKDFKWKPQVPIEQGLKKVIKWQENINFDTAYWNWTNKS